jgi:hypothetical protein
LWLRSGQTWIQSFPPEIVIVEDVPACTVKCSGSRKLFFRFEQNVCLVRSGFRLPVINPARDVVGVRNCNLVWPKLSLRPIAFRGNGSDEGNIASQMNSNFILELQDS